MIKAVVFDWGDTLMFNDLRFDGPMVDWPEVSAIAGAHEALAWLKSEGFAAYVATNAAASNRMLVKAALDRVGLGSYLVDVFAVAEIGYRKPDLGFFRSIERITGYSADELVYVGDDYGFDVLGAHLAGWRAGWLNPKRAAAPMHLPLQDYDLETLHQLPVVLPSLEVPTYRQSLDWLERAGANLPLFRHVELVAAVAYQMALWLRAAGCPVDVLLTQRAGLLHDVGRPAERKNGEPHHELGARFFLEKGYPALAEITRRHGLDSIVEAGIEPRTWEEKLVYLADKMAERNQLVEVADRLASFRRRYSLDPAWMERVEAAINDLVNEVCHAMGIAPEELVPRLNKALGFRKGRNE